LWTKAKSIAPGGIRTLDRPRRNLDTILSYPDSEHEVFHFKYAMLEDVHKRSNPDT